MDKEQKAKKVSGLARKLYWQERRRALRSAPRVEPTLSESQERVEGEPEGKHLATPTEALERVTSAVPTTGEGEGWVKKDVYLSDSVESETPAWPHFRKASEFTGEGSQEDEARSVNTASIWRFARRMMAREWRRALGKSRKDYELSSLEEEAAKIREQIDQRKLREILEEEERQKAERQVSILGNSLTEVAEFYTGTSKEPDPDELVEKIIEAIHDVGFVFDIEWGTGGCDIWLEPWEERKLRRSRNESEPVIYHIGIDETMEVVLHGIAQVDASVVSIRPDDIEKDEELVDSLTPGTRAIDLKEGDEPDLALRRGFSELGKILEIWRDEDGWGVSLEPWAEVRARREGAHIRARDGSWVIKLDHDMVIKSCNRQARV